MTDRHVGSGQTYSTIQSAVNVAIAGDNIVIHTGTYYESVLIYNKHGASTSWITLKPYGTDVVNVDGRNNSNAWGSSTIMIKKSDYIRVTGLNILNSPRWGVTMWNDGEAAGTITSNIRIDHCYIYNSAGMAIHPTPEGVGSVQYITIDHNIVDLANDNWSWDGVSTGGGIPGYGGEAISVSNVQYFEVAYNTVSRVGKETIDIKSGSKYGSVHHNIIDTSTWDNILIFNGTYISDPGYVGANNGIPDPSYEYDHIGVYCDGFSRTNSYIDIYNNYIYGNQGHGIGINAEEVGGSVDHIKVYNNICNLTWDIARPLYVGYPQPVSYVEIYNNTFISPANPTRFSCSAMSNIVVKNNIFVVSSVGYFSIDVAYYSYPASSSVILFSNNLYWRIGGSTIHSRWANVEYTPSTPLSFGAYPVFADPKFISSNDLHLQNISPAINKGITVALTSDYDGNPRPQGAGYDIGAFEYGSFTPGVIDDTTSFIVAVQ